MNHNIAVILSANATSFRSQMAIASASVSEFDKRAAAAGKSGISKFAFAMKTAAVVGVVALGAALASGVQQFAAFEKAMMNVQSISHLSATAFEHLSQETLDLSKSLPQDAKTLAEGLYSIASSGYQGAEGLKVLEQSAKAASAGLTTTEVAAKAIVSVMNAYGRGVEDVTDISDVLFQTVNIGILSFEELATQLGDVVGMASAAGVGIEDVGAAMAAMTLSGISAAEASTSLARLIQKIIDPSKALNSLLKDLGYESGLAAIEQDGLYGVMEKVRVATGGSVESYLELFPEIRAARGAFALAANSGTNYKKAMDTVSDANARAGATQAALDEQLKSFSAQMTLFKNRINAGLISAGKTAVPVLAAMATGAEDLLNSLISIGDEVVTRLNPFWHSAGNIMENVVDLFHELDDSLGAVARSVASVGMGALIISLNILGDILEEITDIISDHPGAFKAVAIVIGGIYLGSLIKAAAAMIHFHAGIRALYALDVLSAIAGRLKLFATGMWEVVQVGGSFKTGMGQMKQAMSGLAGPGVAMGVLGLAVTSMALSWQDAGNKAKAAREEIEKDIDYRSTESVELGIKRTRDALDDAIEQWHEYDGAMGYVMGTLDVISFGALGEDVDGNAAKVRELTDAWYDQQGALSRINEHYAVVGTRLGLTAHAVEMYAMEIDNLDPKTATYDEIEAAVGKVATITENATPKQLAMADAMSTVGDETSNAKDEIDAFKDAIDALIGVELNFFDAQTEARGSIDDLVQSLKDTKAEGLGVKDLFSTISEGGRANREAISGAVQSWIDFASALAEKGDMKGAIDLLSQVQGELEGVLTDAGMSKEAVAILMEQLGLVPGNYEALLTLSGQEAAQEGLDTLIEDLGGLDGTVATAEVKILDATGYDRTSIDSWILNYAMSDPTARVYVDGKPAKPSQDALDLWAERYEESDPTATAILNYFDPQGKYKTLDELAAHYEEWEPTTTVHANTAGAEKNIADLKANLYSLPRDTYLRVHVDASAAVSGEGFLGGKNLTVGNRWGGLVKAMARGGVTPAHIARNQMIKYAEPSTGGEAYVPRLGSPTRSVQVLDTAAGWYGYDLVKMARGGIIGGSSTTETFRGSMTTVVDMRNSIVYGVDDLERKIDGAVDKANAKAATKMRKKATY